jgi:hypothetical protein
MALVHDSTLDEFAFLPERHERGGPAAEELLRWAAWLDDGNQSGVSRERSVDALLEAADGEPGVLTAAWICGLRRQREGTVTRNAVELLRMAIDRGDRDADAEPSLFPR